MAKRNQIRVILTQTPAAAF